MGPIYWKRKTWKLTSQEKSCRTLGSRLPLSSPPCYLKLSVSKVCSTSQLQWPNYWKTLQLQDRRETRKFKSQQMVHKAKRVLGIGKSEWGKGLLQVRWGDWTKKSKHSEGNDHIHVWRNRDVGSNFESSQIWWSKKSTLMSKKCKIIRVTLPPSPTLMRAHNGTKRRQDILTNRRRSL